MDLIINLLAILLSCIIIWRASDGFEVASEYIGRNLKDGVRGATINAIGSSMPELFTTIWFLFVLHEKDGFAGGIGTTAGSAIFNGMIIPAIVILAVVGYGIVNRIKVSKKVILRDGLALICAELVLIFVIKEDRLQWYHGLILMLVYMIYVFFMLKTMSTNDEEDDSMQDEEDEEETDNAENSLLRSLFTLDLEALFIKNELKESNAWGLLLSAMVVIGGSCALLVHSCEGLATGLGIHTYFIAVILASAATSVPDTILSYRDAMSGHYDDAVANALGSNIFDVCFALGFPLLMYTLIYGPITMSPTTIENVTELRVILLGLTIIAFFIYLFGDGMGKIKAFLLLSIYAVFTIFIASKAYGVEWALEVGEFLRGLIPK